MKDKFKLEKFHPDDSGLNRIRYEPLSSGKIIAFGVPGTTLSVLQFGNDIDFDKESDALVEKHKDSKTHLAFEYFQNIGFDDVDIKVQKWFIFD